MRRCTTVMSTARSTSTRWWRVASSLRTTAWQPVSRHSRSKISAGPIGEDVGVGAIVRVF